MHYYYDKKEFFIIYKMGYNDILVTTCLACVIIFSIIIATYATGLKKDFDTKMRSVVDQVNTSQFYQFELEKKSYDKLTNIDTDMVNVKSDKLSRNEVNDRLITNLLDVKNVKQHDGDVNIGGNIIMKDNISLKSNNKSLDVNLPLGTSFNIKDSSGKALLKVDNKLNTDFTNTKNLIIDNKFQLNSGNDNLLKINDKDGKNLFGGMAMANLSVRDNTTLNGTTNLNNTTNINGHLKIKGGTSEHNKNNLETLFPNEENSKNYIRGDTNIDGNVISAGDLNINRDLTVNGTFTTNKIKSNNVKLGHNFGGSWYDASPLSVYSPSVGASFGGDYYSHFPGSDGNTYIRPGKTGASIIIGDQGNTKNVMIGTANTSTKLNGNLCIKDVCLSSDELTKIKQTADNNLLQLQQALKDQMVQAEQQIKNLATQQANQQIAIYQEQQKIREKSLQEQINEIKLTISNIQNRISINNNVSIIGLAFQFSTIGIVSDNKNLFFARYGPINAEFAATTNLTDTVPPNNSLILKIQNNTFTAPEIHVELSATYTGLIRLFRRNFNESWNVVSIKNVNNASFIRFSYMETGDKF